MSLFSLGQIAGLIGFLCLALLIFSGDTARYFDRFFGMDKIIKFQRKFSLFTALFVLAHPVFFMLSGLEILPLLIPNFLLLPSALGAMALYIFMAVMIASALYKRISYAAWQYIHVLTYALFFFSLYHAVNLGSDSGYWQIKAAYFILLMAVAGGAVYRTHYKLKQRRAGKFYVVSVKQDNQEVFTITLKPEKKFNFKAGQFCFLRLKQDRLYARHPFTIASSPEENELRFVVKIQGKFTRALKNLQPGDEVIVDGPFGVFTVKDRAKDLVFIAGGVGIAPFISMLKDELTREKNRNIVLLYGIKTPADIICKQELESIKNSWFKKAYILSNHDLVSAECENGRVNQEVIKKYVRNINKPLFYICGPKSMKKNLVKILAQLGVGRRNIISEDFFW
ncbi:MAG: FAD-binding oxidoreductase [bacterium]|nr:FAD-binding oxidoreductase [bacterium]